jgi:integrase
MGGRQTTGITSRSEGSITIQFMWKGINCRETIKLEPTKANLQYAFRLRAEILRKIELGNFDYAEYFPNSKRAGIEKRKAPLFKDLAEDWLAVKKSELAWSSYITYKKHLNHHWLPVFGEKRINSIVLSDITSHLAKIDASAKTKNNILIPMRSVLEVAFYDGTINTNPADRIKNMKAQKPEPDPFTLDEANLILDRMRKNYHEQVVNYFEFAFFTGLRTSELIELQWGDVEETNITVRRARVEGRVKATKTYTIRQVSLNERAKAAILRQMKHTKMKGKYVFNNPVTDLPWNDQRAQSKLYWLPTLTALKLRERVPYQCRHTFATMMLMAGANPMWVSKQMGHVNMKMLLEVYSRWIDLADKSKEVDKVNSALFSTNSAQVKIDNL